MEDLNREYKDSVFRSIFGTCDEASEYDLALYIALTGDTDVTVDDIKQVQLDNIVTAGIHNDVAFTVKGQMIFLIEHQSTKNPNMPLRMLFYFDKELRTLIKLNKVYGTELLKIPFPVYYVLYNGDSDCGSEVLELENAFCKPLYEIEPQHTLKVHFRNINCLENDELLSKCEILKEYARFVKIARAYKDAKLSVAQAVNHCIELGILKDYLIKYASEVCDMLLDEYKFEDELKVAQDEVAISTSRNIAQNLLVKCGLSKEAVEMSVGYTLDELNLNDDGTLKEP